MFNLEQVDKPLCFSHIQVDQLQQHRDPEQQG